MRLTLQHKDLPPDLDDLLVVVPFRADAKCIYKAGGGVDATAPATETVDADETYVDPNTELTVDAVVDQMSMGGFDLASRDKGGLCQLGSTNKLLDSRSFDPATTAWDILSGTPTVIADGAAGIDGTLVADKIEDDGTEELGIIYQIVSIPNDSTWWTAFAHIRKDNDETRFPEIGVILFNGTYQTIAAQINTKTGAVATTTSTGSVNVYAEDKGTYWKFVVSVKNNTTGNTQARVTIYPAAGISIGSYDNAAVGSIIIDAAQLENHPFATTFIETAGTETIRAVSKFEYDNTSGVLAKAAAGTWIIAFTPQFGDDEIVNDANLIDSRDDSDNDGVVLSVEASTGYIKLYVRSGSVTVASIVGTTALQRGVTYIIVIVWQNDEYRIYVDGAEEINQTTASKPAPTALRTELRIGSGYTADAASGMLAYFLGYDAVLSAARILTLTQWVQKRLGLAQSS